MARCWRCNGTGRITCPCCKGTGLKSKKQKGRLDTTSDATRDLTFGPDGCNKCGGATKLTCNSCNGTGEWQ